MKNMSPLDRRVVGLDEIIYGKKILRHPVYTLQSITIPRKSWYNLPMWGSGISTIRLSPIHPLEFRQLAKFQRTFTIGEYLIGENPATPQYRVTRASPDESVYEVNKPF